MLAEQLQQQKGLSTGLRYSFGKGVRHKQFVYVRVSAWVVRAKAPQEQEVDLDLEGPSSIRVLPTTSHQKMAPQISNVQYNKVIINLTIFYEN